MTRSRGDIVIFKSELQDENGKNKPLIKRDWTPWRQDTTINDGKVYINDKEYDESYSRTDTTAPCEQLQGAKGSIS